MQKFKLFAGIGVVSILFASVTVLPALAWHPKGQIVKKVQNITTGSALSDANTTATAVEAKPGDILKYVIEVSNVAERAEEQYNDMDFVTLTDTLPAGVELVGTPAQRQITENLGLIVPQKKVVKEYQVKVTATKDGEVITNQACFKGDSVVKDNPQSGCDKAVIKVTVPKTPETPVTPVTPVTPQTPEQPAALPQTGITGIIAAVTGISVMGFAAHTYLRSKNALSKAILR